ncbi:hypothetical protein ACFFHH_04120 [Cytobacillus solani]|uniref:hypothetical protein n=1 Tax=Cytobacillus solani TaxID=1637975 RepID=UPI0006ABC51E|nr:hypothetical protein [Cytobacillus solani]KOP71104.1 hypothetical protein AMS60_23930 [Bacillus sp. FJAT-21945]
MKNYIYILSLLMLAGMAACSQKLDTTIKIENIDIKKGNQQSSDKKLAVLTEGKEKKETIWLKEKALYQFEAVADEFEYTVFIFADDEKSRLNEAPSDSANKGEQLYTGHYSMYLAEKDSTVAYKQGVLEQKGELTFSSSAVQAYPLILGENTIIAVIDSESHPKFYFINDGEIKEVQQNESILPIVGTKVKAINQKFIQTAHLVDGEDWIYTTWGFDKESMILFKHDETLVEGQEGEKWYKLWSEKSEYFFPFLNIELTSEVLEKAKQGIPLGSPYPIGTSISNIKKSDPHYFDEGIDVDGIPYVLYPEITYYFEEATGIVNAVSIPGERLKTTLTNVKKMFGTPDQEMKKNEGELAVYLAENYSIEILTDKDGKVERMYLRKK